VHIENATSSGSNLVVFLDRPMYNLPYAYLMQIRKASKERLKVKQDRQQLFRQQARRCRFVSNRALFFRSRRIACHDSLHNASSPISKNHAVVCIEDFKRRALSRSASATSEAPGKKVRARPRLHSSILDRGRFAFPRQLECKLAWHAVSRNTLIRLAPYRAKGQDMPGSPGQ
jgi:hypothetical protein